MDIDNAKKVIQQNFKHTADSANRPERREPKTSPLQEEITKRLKAEEEAEESRKLLQLIFNLSTNFIYLSSDEIDSGINDVLAIIGQYAGADRSYVFLFDEGRSKINNTHEWCAYNIEPQINRLQGISNEDLPWLSAKLQNLEIIHVPNVEHLLPEAENEKKHWQDQSIQSLVAVPIVHGCTLIGFLGLDGIIEKKIWSDNILFLLRMVGEFFASALVQRKAEEQLQESAMRYRVLFEYANDCIFLIKDGILVDCNSEALRLFKCSREELLGQSPYDLSPEFQPDGRKSSEKALEKLDAAFLGKPQFFEWRHRSNNGTLFDTEVSLNKIELGVEVLVQSIVRDVTIRKRWEYALRESEEKYRSLFDDSRDAIYMTRKDGTFVDVNQSFLDLFNFKKEEVLRLNAKIGYSTPEDQESFKKVIEEKDYVKDFEIKLKKRDGTIINCLVTVMAKRNEDGLVIGYQGIIRDITAAKQAEETIRHMAYHDALTGLPNRALCNDRLEMAMANALRNGKKVAVMMLDLDKFKQVNDVLGHKVGDLLLIAVAERLTGVLRKSDTVARMGGDEFLVILPEIVNDSDAGIISEKIIEVFQKPFQLEVNELSVTTSVGLAMYPRDGEDAETLIKNADIAMYNAKGLGRNKCVPYNPEMTGKIK